MSKRKRILQVASYPPPRTGWSVRVQFLKEYLEQHGHECVVLNLGPNRKIPSTEYETVLGLWDYVRKLWRFSRHGFVAHVHTNGASMKGFVLTITAEILNLAAGGRCFMTFHAGVDQQYFPKPKYPVLYPVFWLMFALAKTIICNSNEVKAKIVEYGVNPDKVVPIPAFSLQYLQSTSGTLPQQLEEFYQRCPVVILCYTKIRPVFYPETVLEGFARLAAGRREVGLVVCGTAGFMDPDLWSRVEARLAAVDLHDRVVVVDDLPHEAFLNALARATVYLRSHISDGVCSSIMESLALGVPVVASENGTRPPGVITYPAEDAEALANTLGAVLDRRDEIVATMKRPEVADTLAEEARLLTA